MPLVAHVSWPTFDDLRGRGEQLLSLSDSTMPAGYESCWHDDRAGALEGVTMARTHDLGGRHGFGPVDPNDDEQLPFHEGWEARIFGLVRSLRQNKIFTPDEWRHSVERLDPALYLSKSYYERWILAAERIAIEKGLLEAGQIDQTLDDEATARASTLQHPNEPEGVGE
jgi:hypothetical protein